MSHVNRCRKSGRFVSRAIQARGDWTAALLLGVAGMLPLAALWGSL